MCGTDDDYEDVYIDRSHLILGEVKVEPQSWHVPRLLGDEMLCGFQMRDVVGGSNLAAVSIIQTTIDFVPAQLKISEISHTALLVVWHASYLLVLHCHLAKHFNGVEHTALNRRAEPRLHSPNTTTTSTHSLQQLSQ